jgi:aarF domain-containing kinase
MVRFYRPVSISLPDLWARRNRNTAEKVAALDRAATDATDEVLARLKPLKKDRVAWTNELTRLHEAGYIPQLIFIDAGLATELSPKNQANFLSLFRAVAEFDGHKAGRLMVERSRQPETVIDPEVFALRMQHVVLGVKSKTFALGNVKIGEILNEVLSMVRKHHVRLEGDFVNVVLSMLLLEGIGRQLDPEMDLFAA